MALHVFCDPSVTQKVTAKQVIQTDGKNPKAVPLTAAAIRAIKPPAKGRDEYADGATPGLALRVPAKGDWVWALRMRDSVGTQRRFVLGAMTKDQGLAWARIEAGKMRQGVKHEGRDPKRERREKIEANRLTLGTLVEDWRAIKLADRKSGYAAEAVRALKAAFAADWDKPAAALTAADVRRVLDRFQKAGRMAIAASTMRYGRAAFGWATKRGLVAGNPFESQDAPPVKPRERVLTDDELAEVLAAAAALGGTYGAIVRFLALTGQRVQEVAGMPWAEISEDRQEWTLPAARAKNSRESVIPLSDAARALLPKDRGEPADLAFHGERTDSVYAAWSKAKTRLDAAIMKARVAAAAESGEEVPPMPAWRLHDLRRTVATGLQRLGVRLEVTEAVLNHVSGSRAGIVGIYQLHTWSAEKQAALDAWAKHVEGLLGGQGGGDSVLPFRVAR